MPGPLEDVGLAEKLAEKDRELLALRKALRKKTDHADKHAEMLVAVKEAAYEASLIVGHAEPVKRPMKDTRKRAESALVHVTDWQLGKRTESYDMDTCIRRVRETARKVMDMTEIQRADHPVTDCHILLGGDLLENVDIFAGQAYEIEASAFIQLFEVSNLIQELILTLLQRDKKGRGFENVYVYEVPGNHGRIGRKGDYPRGDNFDLIAGKIARDRLAHESRVVWKDPLLSKEFTEQKERGGILVNPPLWYSHVVDGNYSAILIHGDQVKSWGGNFPAQGIMKKANAFAAGAIDIDFDDLYLGHLHQPMLLQMAGGGLVRMTPSTESGSAYAPEFAGAHGRAGQRLNFIDPEKGRVTAEYLLWLDD